jgi:hypothetical protein
MEDSNKKSNSLVHGEIHVDVSSKEILDKVQYIYSNHARLSSSKWDVRIAFGEIGPTGQVEGRCGVVLSHVAAKNLAAALDRVVKALEQRIGEIVDPDKKPPKREKTQEAKKRRPKPTA